MRIVYYLLGEILHIPKKKYSFLWQIFEKSVKLTKVEL